MAKFSMNGLNEISASLEQMANAPEDTKFGMLEAGAQVLIEKWRDKIESLFGNGQLSDSIKAKRKKGDSPIVQVSPQGNRASEYRGIRKTKRGGYKKTNAEVAYVLEYGTPRMDATHWMETANEEAADSVAEAEAAVWDEYLKSLNL